MHTYSDLSIPHILNVNYMFHLKKNVKKKRILLPIITNKFLQQQQQKNKINSLIRWNFNVPSNVCRFVGIFLANSL
jgi:hypothetical protein